MCFSSLVTSDLSPLHAQERQRLLSLSLHNFNTARLSLNILFFFFKERKKKRKEVFVSLWLLSPNTSESGKETLTTCGEIDIRACSVWEPELRLPLHACTIFEAISSMKHQLPSLCLKVKRCFRHACYGCFVDAVCWCFHTWWASPLQMFRTL